jgi:hypothetical protein
VNYFIRAPTRYGNTATGPSEDEIHLRTPQEKGEVFRRANLVQITGYSFGQIPEEEVFCGLLVMRRKLNVLVYSLVGIYKNLELAWNIIGRVKEQFLKYIFKGLPLS